MKMTKKQKGLYKKIFIGFYDQEKQSWVKPSITYFKTKFKNISPDIVEDIASDTWMKLLISGKEFNYHYFQKAFNHNLMKQFNKNKKTIKAEKVLLNYHDNEELEEDKPTLVIKRQLTEDENKMIDFLKQGLSQRQIVSKGFNSNKQTKLRKRIKEKVMVV